MATTYSAKAGDMLDEIAWRHYGAVNADVLRQVYAANPALTRSGPTLAPGAIVQLPDIAKRAETQRGVSLWD